MDKKKKWLIVAILVVIVGIVLVPKIYKESKEKIAQKALISDATSSIHAICEKYGIPIPKTKAAASELIRRKFLELNEKKQ